MCDNAKYWTGRTFNGNKNNYLYLPKGEEDYFTIPTVMTIELMAYFVYTDFTIIDL